MDPLIAGILGAAIGLLAGCLAVWLVMRARAAAAAGLAASRHETALATVRGELQADLAAAETAASGLQTQLQATRAELAEQQERQRAESAILERLAPVAKSISDMKDRVESIERERLTQHADLKNEILNTQKASEAIRQSAAQLREVMKSNNQRGRWGELQLRSVAQAAGMVDRVDFDTQQTIHVDGRPYRPDMVVRLPGSKTIAVDAKVPFSAYLEAAEIPITAGEAELGRRDALLKEHVKAVRAHIDALSSKSYWSGLENTPEMVVAFIPSESLLGAALEADPDVLEYAFGKHVALASPVTLFSVLKAIAVSWTHEEMSKEAREVFDVSRTLYERLVTLAERVDKLGRSLTTSVKDYNEFVGTLERSVIPQARKIAKTSPTKALPEVAELDANVREIANSDLTQQLDRQLEQLLADD